tara:strand:- start:186 stop:857 length:672 start_codon:yes stop_codon:yes gene_type:complete
MLEDIGFWVFWLGFFITVIFCVVRLCLGCINKLFRKKRLDFIKNYEFSVSLKEKLKLKHPQLSEDAVESVFLALKDYFIYFLNSIEEGELGQLSMPSKVVDDAWHEFILFTQEYQVFCKRAFGKFLHHTPAEPYKKGFKNWLLKKGKYRIRSVWKFACKHEGIENLNPEKLPRLFAIDKLLEIEGGYFYSGLENPLDGEVSVHDIQCSGGNGGFSCGGGCGGD